MNRRDRLKRFLTTPFRGAKSLSSMTFASPAGLWFSSVLLPNTRWDFRKAVGDGLRSSTVVAPVLWAARAFPEAPAEVMKKDKTIDGHPLTKLLRRPNEYFSGHIMWMATVISLLTDGNAYWLKVRGSIREGVTELWWVPPWIIEPKGNENEFITEYVYTPGGIPERIDPNDVVHFRFGIDPNDIRKGMSPIRSVIREVFTDDEAANFTAAILKNSGVPGLILSPKEGTAPMDDVKATKEYIEKNFTGDRRGKPIVMTGPTTVEQLGWSPEQLRMRDIRRIPEERVSAVIGIPAVVCGLGAGLEKSTFNNVREAKASAWDACLIPLQRLISEELRHQLLRDFEDDVDAHEVVFNKQNVEALQEDRNQEADRWRILVVNGIATRAEAREALKLDVDKKSDNVFLLPSGLMPVPRDSLPPEEAPPEPLLLDGEIVEEPLLLGQAGRLSGVKLSRNEEVQWVNHMERIGVSLADVFAREMNSVLNSWGRIVADLYMSAGGLEAASSGNGSTKQARTVEEIMRLIDANEFRATRLSPAYQKHYLRVAKKLVSDLNDMLALGVSLPDTIARKIVATGGRRAGLIDLTTETRNGLFSVLEAARTEGWGPDRIAREIRHIIPKGPWSDTATRSRVIARTETKYAQNVSSLSVYSTSPAISGVRAYDNRTGYGDADCSARDGQVFSLPDAEGESSAEHPNGTLSWAPVTFDEGVLSRQGEE